MKTNQENKAKPALKLTERQIADFTKLAELQKEGDANGKDRKLITDAYRACAVENDDALASDGGVRDGKLKVWSEVKRTRHAEIVE